MAVILRYFTEFGKHAFQHITASNCGGIYARVLLYFVVRAQCRRNESSRSLSHLLMSFLFLLAYHPIQNEKMTRLNDYCHIKPLFSWADSGGIQRGHALPPRWQVISCATIKVNKMLSYRRQRDRAAGCVVVFAKSRRLELGDNILRTV